MTFVFHSDSKKKKKKKKKKTKSIDNEATKIK